MLPYCLKCRKNSESRNSKVVKTKMNDAFINIWSVLQQKLKFIKEQEANNVIMQIDRNKSTHFKSFTDEKQLPLKVYNKCNKKQAFISRK